MDGHDQPAAVRARGIVKSFGSGDTQVTVLKGINLDIYLGEMLLLVGESGGGKTTLLSALAGILDIDEGDIDVLGVPLSELPAKRRTQFRGQTMGFIYQQFNLLPALTAAENVAVPLLIQNVGDGKPSAARGSCWSAWDSATGRSSCRRIFPAVSSSASPLRGLWSTNHAS